MISLIKDKRERTILFLAAGLTSIYGFPNMKVVFYTMVRSALDLTDTQVSMIFAVFGAVALIAYIIGGLFTDQVPLRYIICGALLLSGALHLIVSFRPSYVIMLVISALMSIAAIFLFFPASSKVINIIGGAGNSGHAGRLFGIYYSLEACFTLCVNLAGKVLYSYYGDEVRSFAVMTRLFGIFCFISAVFLFFVLEDSKAVNKTEKYSFKTLKNALSGKSVWLLAFMTCGAYISYTALSYIPDFLSVWFGVSGDFAITLSIIRVNIMTIAASYITGLIIERRGSTIVTIKGMAPLLALVSGLILLNTILLRSVIPAILLTMCFAFIVLGIKAVSISCVSEMSFPPEIAGSIIGIVSFIGYSPDAFFYAVMGRCVDSFGEVSYVILWIVALCGALICYECARALMRQKES